MNTTNGWMGKRVTFRHEGADHPIYGVVTLESCCEGGDVYIDVKTDSRVYEDVSVQLDEVELLQPPTP